MSLCSRQTHGKHASLEELLDDPIMELIMHRDGTSAFDVVMVLLRVALARNLGPAAEPVPMSAT